MHKTIYSIVLLSLLAGCGGSGNTTVVMSPKTTPAPLETNPFLAIADDTSCANLQNRLFVIDQQYVLSEKRGSCSDAQYRQTLYGKTPENIICTNMDSIAGPRFSCSDPSATSLFKRAIENLDLPDLGLGINHQVQPLNIKSNTESALSINSFAASLFYGKAPLNVVIKEEKLWKQFIDYGKFNAPTKLTIDFGNQMVLGSFFKIANNCSQSHILKVTSNGQKVTAQYLDKNIVAIKSCDQTSDLASTPMNLVSVTRLELPVEFVDIGEMTIPFEVIEQNNFSAISVPRNLVIKDQAAWSQIWSDHMIVANTPPPIVDFTKKMVIAIFAGSKPNGCYGISEVFIWRNNNKINVSRHETTPPPGMICTQAIQVPAYMLAIDKSNDSVDFTTIPVIY